MTKFTWTIPPRVHVNVVTVQERIADSFGEIFFRGKFFFGWSYNYVHCFVFISEKLSTCIW